MTDDTEPVGEPVEEEETEEPEEDETEEDIALRERAKIAAQTPPEAVPGAEGLPDEVRNGPIDADDE